MNDTFESLEELNKFEVRSDWIVYQLRSDIDDNWVFLEAWDCDEWFEMGKPIYSNVISIETPVKTGIYQSSGLKKREYKVTCGPWRIQLPNGKYRDSFLSILNISFWREPYDDAAILGNFLNWGWMSILEWSVEAAQKLGKGYQEFAKLSRGEYFWRILDLPNYRTVIGWSELNKELSLGSSFMSGLWNGRWFKNFDPAFTIRNDEVWNVIRKKIHSLWDEVRNLEFKIRSSEIDLEKAIWNAKKLQWEVEKLLKDWFTLPKTSTIYHKNLDLNNPAHFDMFAHELTRIIENRWEWSVQNNSIHLSPDAALVITEWLKWIYLRLENIIWLDKTDDVRKVLDEKWDLEVFKWKSIPYIWDANWIKATEVL